MTRFFATVAAMLYLGVGTASLQAAPILTKLYATQDAGIASGTASNVGLYGFENADTNGPRRAMVQWDVSSIPSGSTIQSAILRMASQSTSQSGKSFSVLPLTESWVEGNGASNGSPYPVGSQATGVTWTSRDLSLGAAGNWATAGGTFDSGRVVAFTGGASQNGFYDPGNTGSTSFPVTYSLNVDVASIVQAWVNGDIVNNGIALRTNETSFTPFAMRGREYGMDGGAGANSGPVGSNTPQFSPALEVTYVAPVPEPGTVGLLAAGLGLTAGVYVRRRR